MTYEAWRISYQSSEQAARAAYAECVRLRAKIDEMEKQEPVAWIVAPSSRPFWGEYARQDAESEAQWCGGTAKAEPIYHSTGAPSVPECPYPCGWRSLLKLAIEDGAYLARHINEDEPVTENARTVTMRMVLRLRDVLMALNNAAPEAKP